MSIYMNCVLMIVSISILLIILIPHVGAKSGGIVSYFTGKPGSFPIGNVQASGTNLTLLNESVIPKDKSSYDFVSVGDWGCTGETDKTVANILKREPNLIIGLGDYAYSDSVKCWMDKIKPFEKLVRIVLGNHENVDNYAINVFESLRYSIPDVYMDLFGLKNQYYSFDYANVHFLMMSTEIPYENDSAQFKFVINDLKQASENSTTKWIIVANHRTMYPPYYGPSITLDTSIGKKFRDTYHPLFDLYRVDLVLQGHVHYYQRSFPLKYNTLDPEIPIVTDLHKNYYIKPLGPMFITIGTGGVEIGHPESIANPFYTAFSKTGVFGILNLEIKKDGSALKGIFYNNEAINKPYEDDIFTIIK